MDQTAGSDLRGLLRSGLSKSLVSLVIKVATAGLTYLMYVILSRMMGITEYGFFAFGLSLATILAIGANYGQQTAILRYWPEETVAGRPQKALNALRAGGAVTIIAGVGITLILLAGGAVAGAAGLPSWNIAASQRGGLDARNDLPCAGTCGLPGDRWSPRHGAGGVN